MTVKRLRGDAKIVTNIWRAIPSNVIAGAKFTLTISNKAIEVEATDSTVAGVAALWLAAIAASTAPEWREVAASLYIDSLGITRGINMVGPSDGTPIEVTESTAGATIVVAVSTVQQGIAGQNMIQKLALNDTPSGGTFKIGYLGNYTANIAWNASNATIQSAIEGLAGIGAGQATVTGATGLWYVEITGTLARTTIDLLQGDGTLLTGAANIRVDRLQAGTAYTNYKQEISSITGEATWAAGVDIQLAGAHVVSLGLVSTMTVAQIYSALDTEVGPGNFIVTKTTGTSPTFIFEWVGIYQGTDNIEAVLTPIQYYQVQIERIQEPGAGVPEIQIIREIGSPTGGTFTVTWNAVTSGSIAYDATAGTVQTALEAMSNIAPGDVAVTGDRTEGFTVTFGGALTGPQNKFSGTSSLTGAGFFITAYQASAVDTDEVQYVSYNAIPSSGNFTLTYAGQTTANIAYNAADSAIVSALEALSNIGVGEVTVTGDYLLGWRVTFTSGLGGTDVAEMTGTNVSLAGAGTQDITLTEVRVGSGPNWWSAADNWEPSGVPADGDIAILDGPVQLKYGLDQSGVDLTRVVALGTFTGGLGLDDLNANGYWEYRDKDFQCGTAAGTQPYIVGEGPGSGCSIFRVHGQSTIVNMRILGTSNNSEKPAVQLRGGATGANSRVEILKGSFGFCLNDGETGTLADLVVGYTSNVDGDASYQVGADATVTQITQDGGSGLCTCTGHSVLLRAGAYKQERSGWTIASWVQEGGNATLIGSGTMSGTPKIMMRGQLALLPSDQNISFANPPQVYGDSADLDDRHKRGIATGQVYLDIDYIGTTRFPSLGNNVRIRRTGL